MWRVLRERSVVMGGMRALLMHAAHPLVAAAMEKARGYERDPWGRHERTLRLTFALVFGSRREATTAARQINAAHRSVHGLHRASGLHFDARNPDLLLWVHASLVSSFLLFERLTVRGLGADGRQRFHEEATVMAGLLSLPSRHIPADVGDLDNWIDETIGSGILMPTDGSRRLWAVMSGQAGGPSGARSRAAAFLAAHTLPPDLRVVYGIDHGRREERRLQELATAIRFGRLALPASARFIAPAIAAFERTQGRPTSVVDAAVLPRRRRSRC